MHRVSQSSRTYFRFSFLVSNLIVLHTAVFQRSGGVLVALPAMHDACHDAHQDVLCWLPEGSDGGYIQALI